MKRAESEEGGEQGEGGRKRRGREKERRGGGGVKKTIIKAESSEEKEEAFAEGFRICNELWLCHPERLAQVRGINPLDRPCVTMEE